MLSNPGQGRGRRELRHGPDEGAGVSGWHMGWPGAVLRPCLPGARHAGMRILDNVISDRGSKYAVSGGPCHSATEARAMIAGLCHVKKFARASHHSWALICDEGSLKHDDGEAGAGMVILRMLEREGVRDHLIVVSRWFGGKHLGGDRFRHVAEAVRLYMAGA